MGRTLLRSIHNKLLSEFKLSSIEQSILHNQQMIKLAIKLFIGLLIFIGSILLFIGSFDEFDSTTESVDKFKPITSSINKLECKEPNKSVKSPRPGTAKILLNRAPDWFNISLHKIDNSKNCSELFSKIKLGQSIKVLLRLDNMVVGHLEVENKVFFTHLDYVAEKKGIHKSNKWIYLIICFYSLFYLIVTARRTFT